MLSIKIAFNSLLCMYAWIINDEKLREQYRENLLITGVSRRVRYYRTHFFN